MINLPLVTIMIPTFNQAEWLKTAVRSALSQDYPALEVIVGDDCSTDDTSVVLSGLSDSRLRWHTNTRNLGRVGNYRDLLYNHAKGEWVLNLDGDDFLTDHTYISAAVAALQATPEAVLVFADYHELTDGTPVPLAKDTAATAPVRYYKGWDYFFSWPRRTQRMNHLSCLYSRKHALDLDFYSCNIISSDYQSLFRLFPQGGMCWIESKVGVWRKHQANASTVKTYRDKIQDFQFVTTVYHFHAKHSDASRIRLYFWRIRNLRRKLYAYVNSACKAGDSHALGYLFKDNPYTSVLLVLSILFSPLVWVKIIRSLYLSDTAD